VVVESKHLDGAFAWIAAQQQQRDAARLANPKLTGREKRRARPDPGPSTTLNPDSSTWERSGRFYLALTAACHA
jgi:hypothetical protein